MIRLLLRSLSCVFCCASPLIAALEFKNVDPVAYHNNSAPQWSYAMWLFNRCDFKGNEAVLDLGCGDGKVTSTLAGRLPLGKVLGVDLSSEMIAFASRSYLPGANHNLSYAAMDALSLQLDDESFHVVFSSWTLHLIEDHSTAISQIQRVLKKGGHFFFNIPLEFSPPLQQATEEVIQRQNWALYFSGFTPDWYVMNPEECFNLLASHGFSLRSINVIRTPSHRFRSFEELKLSFAQWFPYLDAVPEESREKFLDEVLDRYFELIAADPSLCHFDRLEVEAVKKG